MTTDATACDCCHIKIAGEEMLLTPDPAIYWSKTRTLFIADVHLGKAAAFRATRIPVPRGSTDRSFLRLATAVTRQPVDHLVLLGDLWHDPRGRTDEIEDKLCDWLTARPDLRATLVTGNHDLKSGPIRPNCPIEERDELLLGPFLCRHHPPIDRSKPRDGSYILCGHIHPAVRLEGRGEALRLPCFWFTESFGVLPAFGEFTGLGDIKPLRSDEIYPVTENRVHRIG